MSRERTARAAADRPTARIPVIAPDDRILLFWAEFGRSVELAELASTRDIVRPPGLVGLVGEILGGRVPAMPIVLPA